MLARIKQEKGLVMPGSDNYGGRLKFLTFLNFVSPEFLCFPPPHTFPLSLSACPDHVLCSGVAVRLAAGRTEGAAKVSRLYLHHYRLTLCSGKCIQCGTPLIQTLTRMKDVSI